MLAFPVIGIPTIEVGVRVPRVDLDSATVIGQCLVMLARVVVGIPTIGVEAVLIS